jgi:pyruvate,orthophosphate dikinase
VVGCENLLCSEKDKVCELAGVTMQVGDYISINGHKGSVYQGKMTVNPI